MPAKVEVVHMSSPLCHWSWGFEPVVNRLQALYGKQVSFFVGQALPYVDREEWMKDYGMNEHEAVEWARNDILPKIGVPAYVPPTWTDNPASCLPAGLCVKAAGLVHGPAAERRLSRHIMNAFFVEAKDVADDKVLGSIVESLGLDNAKMIEVAQSDAASNALGDDGARGGHGANFYSLLVRDGLEEKGTTLALEHAYDPARVERAIDFMLGKKAKKSKPSIASGLAAYVEENGLVSLREVQTMFAVDKAKAKAALDKLAKSGDITAKKYAAVGGATFWSTASA